MTAAIPLGATIALAAVWLAVGVVADGLPDASSARALRQRAGAVIALTAGGLAGLVALLLIPAATPGMIDPRLAVLVPAVVAGVTLRRVVRIRAAAGAFTSAPGVPLPPALRAGAAHPMIAVPSQVTGLATVVAVVLMAGWPLVGDTATVGVIVAGLALAVPVLAVRHALRYSRLSERAITVRRRMPATL
ncbi:hypothetical protein [Catenuloplanes atrovinosus]|uniref:Uncharacterized protein n=1 Tax=Catenuloplanes atrovinosus TaxID=137266 RepID=A0AAE3YWK5_9ACTN|nr:hypothetical protein [Catenuloplanes atrovinosus]MDR7280097.1 hypothetical protein [Catenuloplanes atrovinosus]